MGIDMEVSKQFQRLCVKQGLKFKLNTKVTAAKREGEKVKVYVEGVKDGKAEEVWREIFYNIESPCFSATDNTELI